MFRVISENTAETYFTGNYIDCEKFLHNSNEEELYIEEF